MQDRIVANIANRYKVKVANKEYICYIRGNIKQKENKPVVGDMVKISLVDKDEGVIEEILPRTVWIKRPKMSNITQVIFVIAAKNPRPDLLVLDKQIAYSEFLKLKVVIVINKIDLSNDYYKLKEIYTKIGYPVIEMSVKDGIGIQELKKVLKGNINAFSGLSGVGKSSLINLLFEKELTLEGNISRKNKKGKNTTTGTVLYEIDKNTYIADTPGFSSFTVEEIPSKELFMYFKEFTNYVQDCEYVDCMHIKEESCGIRKSVEEGKISNQRYENYCKVYQELKEKEEY